MTDKKLLTAKELAERLNMNVQSIYSLAQQGKIPSLKIGKSVRFDYQAVAGACSASQIPKISKEDQEMINKIHESENE